MPTNLTEIEVSELLKTVSDAIKSIKHRYDGLVTVICPTNTSSVFLRRQYESINQQSLGVRFTTVSELSPLLEDASRENTISTRTQTIPHFDTCVSIARKLFPNASAWVKAPLISSTLELLYSMDDEFHEQALNDYEVARQCLDEYSRTISPPQSTQSGSIPLEKIMGKCIVVGYQHFDRTTKRFIARFGKYIENEILMVEQRPCTEIELFENPYDEITAILEDFSSNKEWSLNNCIMIVPENKYKLLATSIAQLKGIPLAGSSPSTIASHPFCELARYFLSGVSEAITRERIITFVEKFPWIKNPQGKHPLIDCHNGINSGSTVGQYFKLITEFIAAHIRPEFFREDAQNSPDMQFSNDAFSLLTELASSKSKLTKSESIMLLNLEAKKKPLRLGSLGDGLYIALPAEVFGSSFEKAFICMMNDTYVSPTPLRSSLIPRDQYERYGVNGKKDQELDSQNLLSWIRNCSANLKISSSKYGVDGKPTVLPYWAKVNSTDRTSSPIYDFNWDDTIAVSAKYLSELLSDNMNHVNSLAHNSDPLTIPATGIEEVALCPSKYFHKRILKETTPLINEDPDILLPTVLGTFVHNQLENYVAKTLSRQQLIENIHLQIIKMERAGELPHNASVVITTEKLERLVNNFLTLHDKANAKLIEVEIEITKTIETENQEISIRGKIDRIQHNENGTTLVDYKTGKLKNSGDIFHLGRKLQLGLYALMREENTNFLEYWHLSEDEALVDRVEWDDHSKNKAHELLGTLGGIINKGVFVPRDEYVEIMPKSHKHSSMCSYCELEPYCYSEQRLLWHKHKSEDSLANYAHATGESVFEESVQ